MTLEEQRSLFEVLTPEEFMDLCVHIRKKNGRSLPICTFIAIRLIEENDKILSERQVAFKDKLNSSFGNLDIGPYKKFYSNKGDLTSLDIKNILKENLTSIQEQAKKVNNHNIGIDHTGLIEYLKSLKVNLDFSEDDRKNKGIEFNRKKLNELFNCFDNFKGKIYQIDNIKISLSARQFTHILVGHIENYKIPRKGKMVQFDSIDNWKTLISFIDKVIDSIKNDLIIHYTSSRIEYNNTEIRIGNKQYGIHIGKYGDIRTFYQVASE